MRITAIGIDVAKNVFQVHGVDEQRKIAIRKRLSRAELLSFMSNIEPTRVGLESCGGANYWAKELIQLGHDAKIIAPQYVKPFVRRNKNDRNDAEAICEALQRPNMRFVPLRNSEQNRLSKWQNRRERWVGTSTAMINQLRGELTELGIVLAQTTKKFRKDFRELLSNSDPRVEAHRRFLETGFEEILEMDKKIDAIDQEIKNYTTQDDICRRLMTIPGIGPNTALAIRASVSEANDFKNGRHFSAWLGLVPRQNSSGETIRLGAISKRGDGRIRCLLVHGARAALRVANRHPKDKRLQWALSLKERKGHNKAAVALANRNARIAFALMKNKDQYSPTF